MLQALPVLITALVAAPPLRAHTELDGYSQFGQAKVIRDSFGVCVRSGTWNAERALRDCGAGRVSAPALAPKKAAAVPPPPEPVAPPPPPPPPPEPRAPEPAPEPAEVKPLPAAPAAEAATVAASPAKAADPAPVETTTLAAEALFDLSKSAIKPAARPELDALARAIAASPFENVRITGHTDRTGSPELNRKLSRQRASSVKAYLVAKGVPADKIVAEGRGSSEPRTKPSDCDGVVRAQLGACLQPDRRVEIEVRR
jgi:OOP family OmpA-OmpF porin